MSCGTHDVMLQLEVACHGSFHRQADAFLGLRVQLVLICGAQFITGRVDYSLLNC
jgi:hypothetical protein